MHETLNPRQPAFWQFNVSDHALDVMAFMRHIRIIKALEGPQRRYLQKLAAEKRAERDSHRARPRGSRLRSSFQVHPPGGGSDVSGSTTEREGDRSERSLSPSASSQHSSGAQAGSSQEDAVVDVMHREATGGSGTTAHSSASSSAPSADQPAVATNSTGTLHRAPTPPHIDAASADADDCRIVAVGHSMGGAVLLLYVQTARALRRPHWLSRLVLLSPAGLHSHMNRVPLVALTALRYSGVLRRPGPFPARNSTLQRIAARLMQDLKRLQSVDDAISVLASRVFGGTAQGWVFSARNISFTDYPVGGSSTPVIKHGIQCMLKREFSAQDYGAKENAERYGGDDPPSYRPDYALIDVPVHFIAGASDVLIPVQNLEEQYALLALLHPQGNISMRTIDDAGEWPMFVPAYGLLYLAVLLLRIRGACSVIVLIEL